MKSNIASKVNEKPSRDALHTKSALKLKTRELKNTGAHARVAGGGKSYSAINSYGSYGTNSASPMP